jgi:hypothetical protein
MGGEEGQWRLKRHHSEVEKTNEMKEMDSHENKRNNKARQQSISS